MNTEYIIIVMDSGGEIREYTIDSTQRTRLTFGRDASNQIVVHSPIVSRIHGVFETYNGQLVLYDNNSTNGIIVNGRKLSTDATGSADVHCVREGDVIRIDDKNSTSGVGIIMYCTTVKSSGGWSQTTVPMGCSIEVGRSDQCQIRLNNINVSRHHARITFTPMGMEIEDLNSVNGVFVNGRRVQGRAMLGNKDIISIGTSLLIVNANMIFSKSKIGGTRITMTNISRTVSVKGKNIKILDDVNITVEPNEFIAIIGGSGAGKSTVMNAMSGFEQADTGVVMVNNTNLYENYHVLKNIIGYVPQHDIIYENLTLYKMLEYSAKLRMNDDVSPEEREQRVYDALSMVELTEHKDKFIRSLSGGQKKRASIAVELLADPGLFFLDEPTSGLDPGTEASLMETLNRLSKQKGKTIVMVTHTTQNLHLCDKILFMGKGGKVCFYGSPSECLKFFGVDNLTEIYNKVLTDQEVFYWNMKWTNEYRSSSVGYGSDGSDIKKPKKSSFIRQFGILSSRYTALIMNDLQRLMMIFIQPVMVAVLIAIVAADDVFDIYESTKPILFSAACAGIWVGLFNSIQEICKERSILKREYMANLRLGAYVLSKFVVQGVIAVVQAFTITLLFVLLLDVGSGGVVFGSTFIDFFVTITFTIFSSAAIGLIVSALSKNSDKAMTLAPFLLIIQLLFSGILFKLEGVTKLIANFTVSNWSVRALGAISNLNGIDKLADIEANKLNAQFGLEPVVREIEEIFEATTRNVVWCWFVLAIFVAVCFAGCVIILRNVSKDSR